MRFEIFNKTGATKVAFFQKKSFGTTLSEKENVQALALFNDLQVHLFDTDNPELIRFKTYEEHGRLDLLEGVAQEYSRILDYLKDHQVTICIFFGSGYPWSQSFINRVKSISYAACYFGDDPEGSDHTSRWYVRYYDYAFCGGIYFDRLKKTEELYREWGARKALFVPLGANPIKYRLPFNDVSSRNIDLVYVGGAYLKKIIRIFRLKKHFGKRMLIYGRGWNYEGASTIKRVVEYLVKRYFEIPRINELPKDGLVSLYQDTKIGFNMHMSFGPSNLRLYELPMNGVMQICDCKDGLSELYRIDEEVVTYDSISEAIEKIEYYLTHDEERKRIAMAGFKRAAQFYKLENTFKSIMDEIRADKKWLNNNTSL
ncbi:MAG: glycosyltransferase [Candidatus Moraniibacteriota bacterium]|nr:MAG: glycosyltransferase [Candidatus Moranbacteria bacterium]